MLYQFDSLKRLADAKIPGGYYYWTNVYYLNIFDFSSYIQMRQHMQSKERLIHTTDVQFMGYQVHQPPGRGNVIEQISYTTLGTGLIPSEGQYSILDVFRWTFWTADDRPTYRLQRMPIRPSDVEGGKLTPSGQFWSQASANDLLIGGKAKNSYGETLVRATVAQEARMWQQRHGTKRAASRFWLP